MGRPLGNPIHTVGVLPAPVTMFILSGAAVLSVFTVVIFVCGSHTGIVKCLRGKEDKKTVRLGGEDKKRRVIEKMKSSLSSKALLMTNMISWRKVQDGDELEQEDGVVWKKTIIKGEKCRPLDFSGKILYDADGNLLSD